MKYYFDATEDYLQRQREIDVILETARLLEDVGKEKMFLKLAVVSLVTKFQVYIEGVLNEFIYVIKSSEIKYEMLPLYMQLNSIKINISDNALVNLSKHSKFTEETKEKIARYIESISYITDEKQCVKDNLFFKTSFPLGKTGKQELLDLFKQIEGNENIFISKGEPEKEEVDLEKLNALLLTRHLIIHQDRFNETDVKVHEYIDYMLELVRYCDQYLFECLKRFGIHICEKELEEW